MTDESQCIPCHGKLSCTLCFPGPGQRIVAGPWQFQNDPGHWGSANPKILVLGFSKGATQVDVYNRGRFDDVAFAGSRQRLKASLVTLGLLMEHEDVNLRFRAEEKDFAFASLIRCSVARMNGKSREPVTSGSIILKAFKEAGPRRLLDNCSKRFLTNLADRLRLVVMLGVQDSYINHCRVLIGSLYDKEIRNINSVAYATRQITWVHVTHPSPGNGWFDRWLVGDPNKIPVGRKREFAKEAIARISDLRR